MRAGPVIGWALAALFAFILYWAGDTIGRYKAENARLIDDLAKANTQLDRARKGAQRAAQEAQRARTELEGVLNEVPIWRDGGVPEPVRDSLCARLRCAEPRIVPAPAG